MEWERVESPKKRNRLIPCQVFDRNTLQKFLAQHQKKQELVASVFSGRCNWEWSNHWDVEKTLRDKFYSTKNWEIAQVNSKI